MVDIDADADYRLVQVKWETLESNNLKYPLVNR